MVEPSVLSALTSRRRDGLKRYALRLCNGRRDDAEDLLGETMLDTCRAALSLSEVELERCLYRILRTNFIDPLRRVRAHSTTVSLDREEGDEDDTGYYDLPDPKASVEHVVVETHFSEELERALAQLSPPLRAPLLLQCVDELAYEEIAATLQIPLGTVRSRINRGRTRLRELLSAPH